MQHDRENTKGFDITYGRLIVCKNRGGSEDQRTFAIVHPAFIVSINVSLCLTSTHYIKPQ